MLCLKTDTNSNRLSAPLKSWIFFQASLRNCQNCDHNWEDHSSFDFIYMQFTWFISYASFTDVQYLCMKMTETSTVFFKDASWNCVYKESLTSSSYQLSLLIWSPNPGVSVIVSFNLTPFSSITERKKKRKWRELCCCTVSMEQWSSAYVTGGGSLEAFRRQLKTTPFRCAFEIIDNL